MSRAPRWTGAKGEGYVIAQVALIVLVFFGPRTWDGLPPWVFPYSLIGTVTGSVLVLVGGILFVAALFKLGVNLTPLPYPKDEATLVETGPYSLVRHPIYGGGVLMAIGWALLVHGWLTVGYALILFVFFDAKSRFEEKWLEERFANYPAYQKRVRKLIPFVY
jgi:protein-S-isoprenylcysteine O-methyltransferase Ste14